MKRIFHFLLCLTLVFSLITPFHAYAEATWPDYVPIQAEGGIVIDADTGTVLYGKNIHTAYYPASITKIMTLILIFDALDKGSLKMDDTVTTSAHAKSMGGSQVFLEEGEIQTVETLIKCIVIASGNDASVAMAEHICGSEQEFVHHMNERAEGLGMKNTHFEDCCGLTESPDHYTTARDIAIMSRELITKYPKILEYSSIWMENITHVTRQGTKEFGLTNTNKLIKAYPGCNGIKTGFTAEAGYCLSASATRDDTHLIAVALGCETSKLRNAQVAKLFDYGFANFGSRVIAEKDEAMTRMRVERGTPQEINVVSAERVTCLVQKGKEDSITTKIELSEEVPLPLAAGSKVGTLYVMKDGKEVGMYDLLAEEQVDKASFKELILRAIS